MDARPVKDRSRPWNRGLLVGRKRPLQPKHVGLFAFGLRSHARGANLRSLLWRSTASFAHAIWSNFASRCNARLQSRRGPPSKSGYGCSRQLALDISSRADFMHALTYPPGNTPG
jgi:hypothetical protein